MKYLIWEGETYSEKKKKEQKFVEGLFLCTYWAERSFCYGRSSYGWYTARCSIAGYT